MGEAETMTPPPSAQTGGRARWTTLAVLGLLMEAIAPLLLLVAVLVFGLDAGEFAKIFVIVIAVPLIGAALVWRFGWWAKLVGILTALVPAGAMFWTIFGITIVSSFFDFVPAILLIPGFFIAIASLIASLVAGRRGHRTPKPAGRERLAIQVVGGVILLLALISGVMTFLGRSSASSAAAAETVVEKDTAFRPKTLSVDGGDTILIRDDDPFFHTFTIDALDIDESFTPGDEIAVEIPDKPGTYIFYCRPHTSNPKHPEEGDMAGRITIR
jgi:plastocyanin